MDAEIDTQLVFLFKTISKIACALIILLGITSLIGWIFSVPILYSFSPYGITIKANTAFAFTLTGLVILLLHQEFSNKIAITLLSILISLIGFLTLLEYAGNANFSIDTIFVPNNFLINNPLAPVRMTILSALSFLFVGLSLILFITNKFIRVAQGLAIIIGSYGICILMIFSYQMKGLQPFTAQNISVLATTEFILAATALLFLKPQQGIIKLLTTRTVGGQLLRYMLPAIVFIPFITGWLKLYGQQLHFYSSETGTAILSIINVLLFAILISIIASILSRIDITRKKISKQLQTTESNLFNLSHKDALTGLINATVLKDVLSFAITHNRSNYHVAILHLDLDQFRKINDFQGHAKGDFILKEVANRLRNAFRETDTIARWSSDEFIIISLGISALDDIPSIAQKTLNIVAVPFSIDGKTFNLTASIGISLFPEHGHDVQSLLKNAEIAMFYAKTKGGNYYQIYQPEIAEKTKKKIELENELHQAWKRKEFFLCYQPKVSIKSKKVVGVEALVRWKKSDGAIVNPINFIPLVEEIKLIKPLGEWILQTACIQIKQLHNLGFPFLEISANVSAFQTNPAFANAVARILQETNLEPHYLELELTENVLLHETENNISTLKELKQLGVKLSIDDFGTGYSSLGYLKKFSIDSLKIDRSFITDIPQDANAVAITSAIIAMAQSLNIKVIAEGVEKKEQLDFLLANGCDEIQGFYFSKPLTAEELLAFLKTQPRLVV